MPTRSKTFNHFEIHAKVDAKLVWPFFWTSSRIDITKVYAIIIKEKRSLMRNKNLILEKLVIPLAIAFCIFIFIIQNYFDYWWKYDYKKGSVKYCVLLSRYSVCWCVSKMVQNSRWYLSDPVRFKTFQNLTALSWEWGYSKAIIMKSYLWLHLRGQPRNKDQDCFFMYILVYAT